METNARFRGGFVAATVVMLLAGNALASPIETAVVPGLSFRNGDWVAVDALGIVLLRPGQPTRYFAVVIRSELAIGGVSAGFGPAMNLLSGPKPSGMSNMDIFLGSGIVSLEARVERMYWPTSWRHTTYVGGQVSFAGILMKPALTWMVAADDPRDVRSQITLVGAGW